MSGSDRAGRLPRSRCLSLYGLLSAAPARYDNLVRLASEPARTVFGESTRVVSGTKSAPAFALRTHKSHGDLRNWPPQFRAGPDPPNICEAVYLRAIQPCSAGQPPRFRDAFCVRAAFWLFGQAFPQRRAPGLANRFGDVIFHRALTILALTSRLLTSHTNRISCATQFPVATLGLNR